MYSKIKLYGILLSLTLAGYIWLGSNAYFATSLDQFSTLCLFKLVSGIPCPSCGITRSILLLAAGHWQEAIYVNPLGILGALGLLFVPLVILSDLLFSKTNTFRWFSSMEVLLRQHYIAIPLFLLLVVNWTWNIIKGM